MFELMLATIVYAKVSELSALRAAGNNDNFRTYDSTRYAGHSHWNLAEVSGRSLMYRPIKLDGMAVDLATKNM